ncbi:unnamed protein product [Discula destructiva]
MHFSSVLIVLAAGIVAAAPVAQPDAFNSNRLLQISKDSLDSSYDDTKRAFNPSRLLQISKDSVDSSYGA